VRTIWNVRPGKSLSQAIDTVSGAREAEHVDLIFAEYAERMRRLRRDPRSVYNFTMKTDRFDAWLEEMQIEPLDVQPWQIEEYLTALPLSPENVKTHYACIRAAYRYAQARGKLERVPTYDVRLPKSPDVEPRIIPNATLRMLKARCPDSRSWLMFHLYAYTGLRRAEGLSLTWGDVDLSSGTLVVRKGKGGKLRHVPIHPALAEVLSDRKSEQEPEWAVIGSLRGVRGKGVGTTTAHGILRSFAGEDYHFHDFRRSVASSLIKNGVSESMTDKLMGWAPRAVRSRYYVNIATEEMQAAILKLYADDPL
jgi:integrase/recombinase XerD